MSRRWICPRCRTLLGIRKNGTIEIRYKTVSYMVRGAEEIVAICRNCGRRVST